MMKNADHSEILKLAKECEESCDDSDPFHKEAFLISFYRAAYNKAIEDAARVIAPYKCYDAQIDIRRLEMK